MASGSYLVTLHRVTKYYQTGEVQTEVLQDASLKIRPGELVVVLGVSGSGKTTLLNIIGGLDIPSSGKVVVDDEDLSSASEAQRTAFRRNKIGFVFQFFNLIPTLTASENVQSALEILDLSKEEIADRTERSLSEVGLENKTDNFPSQLSGGEQQRVAIARALAKRPKLILADEPTGNLDTTSGKKIMALIKKLNDETGTCVIVATHDQNIVEIADRLFRIHEGKILEEEDVANASVLGLVRH